MKADFSTLHKADILILQRQRGGTWQTNGTAVIRCGPYDPRGPPTARRLEDSMSAKLKWVAIAIAALLVILFVLPFVIPVNKFRPTIETKATEALGRKVQLGNLSLSILSGSLEIDSLSVSDDPKFSNGPFLTA